ncbi:MAG: HEAT repeat domain-containing protein [bacterium]
MMVALVFIGCGREEKGTAAGRDPASAEPARLARAPSTPPSATAAVPGAAGNDRATTNGRRLRRSPPVVLVPPPTKPKVLDVDRQEVGDVRTLAGLGSYLANDGDPELALGRLRQFAAQGDAVIPELLALLADPAPGVACLGAEGLASIGTPAALQELVAYLQALSPEDDQRRELASILAETARNPEGVPYWNGLLAQADVAEDVRDAAVSALAHSLNVTELKDLGTRYAATPDDALRQNLADVVRQLEGAELVPQLITLAGEPATASAADPLVLAAWDTLATMGTPQGVATLLAWTDQVDGAAAAALAHAISMIRNPASLPALQRAADSGSPKQQAAAVRALENFAGQR